MQEIVINNITQIPERYFYGFLAQSKIEAIEAYKSHFGVEPKKAYVKQSSNRAAYYMPVPEDHQLPVLSYG